MKTRYEIMSAPAKDVVKVLKHFNMWRRGKINELYGNAHDSRVGKSTTRPCSAYELGLYIDRAIILLEDMNKLQKTIKRKKGNANERRNRNKPNKKSVAT